MKLVKIVALCGIVGFLPLNAVPKAVKIAGCLGAAAASFVGYHEVRLKIAHHDYKNPPLSNASFTESGYDICGEGRANAAYAIKNHEQFALITKMKKFLRKLTT